MMISLTENIDERENLKDFLEEAELQQYYELFRDILKVTKVSQLKFVVMEDLSQIGLSKPEQRRYKKVYSKYFPNPYISKIKKLLTSTTKRSDMYLQGPSSLPMDFQPLSENNVKVPTKHIISIEDITINKELGMGQFGVVQQGTWATGSQRIQVAIKCLGNERMTSNSTEFLKEAAVMHSIEHPNIVRLYGVVLHLDSLMLVTELAPLRSLLECLREVSIRTNFPVPTLCEFAEQICDGMTYLENKRLIHRDLAARNILVFNKDRVKISDFGLSRALGVGKDYYQTNYNVNLKLPVAWCAPECILYLKFTSFSDVWAFGVTLWEMFTYGFQPWAAFSGQQILEAIDAPNFQRLERPECCPEAYYDTMLACWAHEPNERPKFKDLGLKLKEIMPEQVQAFVNYQKTEEGRRNQYLEYKSGQIITVLGKESMTKCAMWYGVVAGGACGMFDPNQTRSFIKPDKPLSQCGTLSPHPSRSSERSLRPSSILRSDVKRHTYTGKRSIQRSMISSPQGEVKHTGHVGLDGAYFGDISFLDPAGCPPRQVVTPYKPSEDLEQVPLINPNSPSHFIQGSPYPLLTANRGDRLDCDEVDLACSESKMKSLKKSGHKSVTEPTTSKSILNKVKGATLSRAQKSEDGTSKTDEAHEYHEISDNDTKCYGDFSQSLLDEMESIFKGMEEKRKEENGTAKHFDIDQARRSHTLNKLERKKGHHHTGTMKLMSAHDEKTLDTAVAMANEITTKSMNDLDLDKTPNSPSERSSKFHFKFPLVSLHANMHENDKEHHAKQERRNFSEEANSVPDIQATLTEESKIAYASLIEQPTPSTSLITQMAADVSALHKPSTMPKASQRMETKQFHSLQKQPTFIPRPSSNEFHASHVDNLQNEIPLPPRTSKPKLVDKPRHIRKYPLKLSTDTATAPTNKLPETTSNQPIIYQNTLSPTVKEPLEINGNGIDTTKETNGVDVFDGHVRLDTNPFTNISAQNSANPFNYYLETLEGPEDTVENDATDERKPYFEEGSLVKDCTDHVSVEDLLEFANQKPCGRQRGVESDEVRIMCKVLKQQVSQEECLESLELSDWNVHQAIKIIRVRLAVAGNATLQQCSEELEKASGDVVKAAVVLR